MGPADPGTPPDGYSGAAPPGPIRVIGLASLFGVWGGVHTVLHPAVSPRGVAGRSLVRPGAFAAGLAAVAAGETAVPLLLDHDPGFELASTADGSLRLHPPGGRAYFALCGPRAAGLGGYRAGRPRVSAHTRPTACDVEFPPCGTEMWVTEAESALVELSLVARGAHAETWWHEFDD